MKTTKHVTTKWEETRYERKEPSGEPFNKTGGQTEGIKNLVDYAERIREEEQNSRDHGYELYVQHELNGGREPEYDGCWHTEIIHVADGDLRRISTGHTKVWAFCRDCGELANNEHIPCYWTQFIRTTFELTLTGPLKPATERIKETRTWKEGPECEIPRDIVKFEKAKPIIEAVLDNRADGIPDYDDDWDDDDW
jgi:hypothetical protein